MQAQQRPPVPLSQRVFGELVYWITIVACILCIVGPLVAFIDIDENVLDPRTLFQDILDGKPAASEVDLDKDITAGDSVIYLDKIDDFEDAVDILLDKAAVDLEKVEIQEGLTILHVAEIEKFAAKWDAGGFTEPVTEDGAKAPVTEIDSMILIEDDLGEEVAIVAAVDAQAGTITIRGGLLNTYDLNRDAEVAIIDTPVVVIYDDFKKEKSVLRAIHKEDDTLELLAVAGDTYKINEGAEIGEETVWEDAKDGVDGGHYWKDHLGTGDGLTQAGIVLGCSVGFFALLGAAFVYFFKEKSYGWGTAAIWVAFMVAISVVGLVSFH